MAIPEPIKNTAGFSYIDQNEPKIGPHKVSSANRMNESFAP